MNEQPKIQSNTLSELVELIIKTVHLHHLDASAFLADTAIGKEGLALDSVEVLEIVVAVEQHFKVKIESADMGKEHFQTLGTIAAFIDSYPR